MTPTEKTATKQFVERWKTAEGNERREVTRRNVSHLFKLYAEKTRGE